MVGVILLVRGAFLGGTLAARWSLRDLVIIAAVIAAFGLAVWEWGYKLASRFGPPEFAAFIAFELAVAIALARMSRTRAAGMALLGLLLATVGIDLSTGVPRLTLGLDALVDGIDATMVLFGLVPVADGAICLVSPSLFLATYARQAAGWRNPGVPNLAALFMRIAAALAIAAACFYAYALHASARGIVWILMFGVLGVACKVFGWNRLVLYLAFSGGNLLEENIGRAMLLSNGDPAVFLRWPISGVLLLLTGAILAAAALLSVKRALQQPRRRIRPSILRT
jgi:putative tricarboxylic transport membrane protein